MEVIPRTIHSCWFGAARRPPLVDFCRASWGVQAPEFTVMEWSERNFPLHEHRFAASAFEAGKFAFVSDYVRAWALFHHGGVYLDADVELRASLEPFLEYEAFSGFERAGYPFTAVWGARAGHRWPAMVLETYASREFSLAEPTNTQVVSEILAAEFGIDRNWDAFQVGEDGVVIFPSSRLCVDLPVNTAVHHFVGSWLADSKSTSYKDQITSDWLVHELLKLSGADGSAALTAILRQLGFQGQLRIFSLLCATWIRASSHRLRRFRLSRTNQPKQKSRLFAKPRRTKQGKDGPFHGTHR